jgi:hypothetical protein
MGKCNWITEVMIVAVALTVIVLAVIGLHHVVFERGEAATAVSPILRDMDGLDSLFVHAPAGSVVQVEAAKQMIGLYLRAHQLDEHVAVPAVLRERIVPDQRLRLTTDSLGMYYPE